MNPSLRRFLDTRNLLPWSVFVVGLCIAASSALWLRDDIESKAQHEFDVHAHRLAEDIKRRFETPVYGLNGARGVYAAKGDDVSRQQFRNYVESRNLKGEFPGVRGMGFVQRVERAALDQFIARERADEEPHFAVRQLTPVEREDLYVIKIIEPRAPNHGAMGLDLGSEARRRAGAEQAVITGEATLSGAVTLVQDDKKRPGFLLYVPVFRAGTDPSTSQQRFDALLGLTYAPIVAEELLADAVDITAGAVDYDLYDQKDAKTASNWVHGTAASARESRYVRSEAVAVPGRQLALEMRSTAVFEASIPTELPWYTLGLGSYVSLLLALLLRQQATGRVRAEELARGMTADLARLAQVAKHTSNSVVITDPALRIVWINEGFTRISGFSFEEAVGKTHEQLLNPGPEGSEPGVLKDLAGNELAQEGCRVEIAYRSKQGQLYWLDAEFQPLYNAQGQHTGFMEIGSDVTERLQAQAQLQTALRENDALLRTIDMHAIVSMTDRAGNITAINDAFCQISGYSREELLGQNHRIVHSGVQPDVMWVDMWARVSAGKPWRGEVCNKAKDGTFYWVDTIIAPFTGADGEIEKYISIRTDISAHKNTLRELVRERRRLDNILQGTDVVTWEWSVQDGELRLNDRWFQITGYEQKSQSMTHIDRWRELTHPDDLIRSEALLLEHLEDLAPSYECEMRILHKGGHWVWVLCRGKLFSRDDSGRPRWMAGTFMDINERKRADEALQASQTFLDQTGSIAGVGGWSMNFESDEIQWTTQTCRLHDCEPGHQPTIAEQISYFDPDAQTVVQRAVQRSMDHGEGHDLELPMTTAKGRKLWVRAVGAVEYVNGKPAALVGAMQDITKQRLMEQELRRNNEVMSAVLENLPCGLSVFDGELNLVAANPMFRRLLELPDQLFENKAARFDDIIRFNASRGEYGHDNVEATVQQIIERARAPATPHLFERVRPNGLPLEIRGGPMPGGGFVTTYTDITDRRQAEAEMRSMALDLDRLAQVARRTSNAVVITDANRLVTWVNEGFERISGYSAAEVLGKSPGAMLQFEGTDPSTVQRMREALNAGQPFQDTILNRSKDGRVYRLEIEIQPLHAKDGSLSGFMAVESDITKLVRATEAAQEATRAKSQFLANMSHEIRTPMNAIIGMTDLVLDSRLEPDQRELLDIVKSAGDALLSLINDILDFSKIEAGQMTLEAAEFDLHDCVRSAAIILNEKARDKGIALEWTMGRDVPRRVMGDAHRLRQVLINLLSNAVKFTSSGWVLLSVAVAKGPEPHAPQRLEFRVRDTGPGIPSDKLDTIFTAFGQADGSITRKFGGTGLGLSISTELVERMGGRIGVESTVGEGSTFHFTIELPAATSPSVFGELPSLPANAPVLVLDRAPLPDKALANCLSMWQMTAHTVRTPAQVPAAAPKPDQAVEPLLVKASWLPLCTPQRWQEIVQQRPLITRILLQDAPTTSDQDAEFGHRLPWPAAAGAALFDALSMASASSRTAAQHGATGGTNNTDDHQEHRRYVLLVDDIAVNRKLAVRLLENMGHVVAVATNGLEAVAHIEREDVDLVLMDLQMPVMDGFKATARIQQHEASKARKTPIVAMTAHALQEEKQSCLDAGMLGHVSKPISKQALQAAVQTHALPRKAADMPAVASVFGAPASSSSAPAAAPMPAPMQAKRPLRDEATALEQLGGDRELLEELVQMFLADLPAQLLELEAVGTAGDWPKLAKLAHAQKGAAGAIGAGFARAAASALETAAYAGDGATITPLLTELLAQLGALQADAQASSHMA